MPPHAASFMRIVVTVPGAPPAEISERTAAAQAVFDRHGVDPRLAAVGQSERERWDMLGFGVPRPSHALMDAASTWDAAMAAAIDDTRPGWTAAPAGASLALEGVDWSAPVPGMPEDPSDSIIAAALDMRRRYPDASAVEILDLVMEPYAGTHPTFRGRDREPYPLDPRSPFGKLLHEAFNPMLGDGSEDHDGEMEDEAIRAFGDRYRLWRD